MKAILIYLIMFVMINQLHAQGISGGWQGAIAVNGNNLHLVFHIKKTGDNSYSATFDSPDQKAFGIACSDTRVVKDSLLIKIAVINASYSGTWDANNAINGMYKQGGHQIALNLTRIAEDAEAGPITEVIRPQTPTPPFNYLSEAIEYDNADKSLHYGATFTKPKGEGQFPAVIIISGSGTQDRDGTIFGHKLYWVLADYLTKNGIAVLRVDDRGAGKSTIGSNFKNATSVDFSYDVEASLNYLERRKDVNRKHLGLIGHSEGGVIAPMVAARRKDVSFIVMWGAPEAGGAKINTEQNVHLLKQQGLNNLSVKEFSTLHESILALFSTSTDQQDLDNKILPVFGSWKKSQSKQTTDALNVGDKSIFGKDVLSMYNSLYDLSWMRFFISYKPEIDLMKVKCSVLAVNGAKDTQVNADENLRLIKEVLTKSGNKDFETVAIPGLNHLLQTATTGEVSEYEKIDETMSPVALNIICSWIKLHTR